MERVKTLQENVRDAPLFYNMFCRVDGEKVKLCTFYGDENLCPVRCNYSIERAKSDLERTFDGGEGI